MSRAIGIAVVSYILILSIKIVGYAYTNLFVLLAEAFHTLIDLIVAIMLFVLSDISARPPDKTHRYGHARFESLGALIASMVFISIVSIEIMRESLIKMLYGGYAHTNTSIGIVIILISIGITLIPTFISYSHLKKGEYPAVRAQMTECINDQLSHTSALIGILMVYIGYAIGDGIASFAVGIFIMVNGLVLLKQSVGVLTGKSPDESFYRKITEIARTVDGVKGVHDMKAEYVGGNSIHMDMHITVNANITLREADIIVENLTKKLKENGVSDVTVDVCTHY